jgi:CRISPR-associated endonuclease/helicase Cas3
MEFYSHIDKANDKKKKLLKIHLYEVRKYGIEHTGKKELIQWIELLALSHDFGKYTTYFQHYLREEAVTDELKNHGLISAFLAAYLAMKRVEKNNSIVPLLCFQAILCHHGNLKNLDYALPYRINDLDRTIKKRIEILKEQFNDLDRQRELILKEYASFGYQNEISDFFAGFNPEELYNELKKEEVRFTQRKIGQKEGLFYQFQYLYSLLIAGDKLSAANLEVQDKFTIDYKYIWQQKEKMYPLNVNDKLNKMRSDIFAKVQEKIKLCYQKGKLFTIIAPTGSGKTCTGFYAALKLRELLDEERRIVYVLPFTTLINDNFKSVQRYLGFDPQKEDYPNNCLLKHHHLTELNYRTAGEEYSLSQAELLVENWQSEIIVTTYVQLFHSILTHRNRMQKKVHSLEKAIIILDEIQAIDAVFYPLLDKVLNDLSEYYDCQIILMTATKPVILSNAIELLEEGDKYFKELERTVLQINLSPISIAHFVEEFIAKIEEKKSYLIVCNTIQQSLDIYNGLKSLARPVLYLSSNLVPYHRRERIEQIKSHLKDKENPPILVSTQVVEAGIDFDFDEVIRDFAPLDSIIQCAGRCNRNNLLSKIKRKGIVRVVKMITEDGKSNYARFIYGPSNLQITQEVLEQYEGQVIPENKYQDLLYQYFVKLERAISKELSLEFGKAMDNFDYDSVNDYCLKKFSLIKNNPSYISVFFRVNEEAEKVYWQFKNLYNEKNLNKRYEKYLSIKAQFLDFIITMPNKFQKYFVQEEIGGLFFLSMPPEGCEDYYNEAIGFLHKEKDSSIMM